MSCQMPLTRVLGGILSLLFATVFYLPCLRPFCARHYEALCASWVCLMHLAFLLWSVNRDMRLMLCGSDSQYSWHAQYENISFGISFGPFPHRICRDATPARTLLLPFRGMMPAGCSATISYGRTVVIMCGFCLLPAVLKMSQHYARVTGVSIGLIYVAACFASGYVNATFVWTLVLQACTSIITSGLCAREEEISKSRFAATMAIRFT